MKYATENWMFAFIFLFVNCPIFADAQTEFFIYSPPGNLSYAGYTSVGSPIISGQPQSLVFFTNSTVQYSVFASGSRLSYQWLSNGVPIVAATNSSLNYNAVSFANWVLNGGAIINSNGVLTLTDGQNYEARSAYYSQPVVVSNFVVSFTFQDANAGIADGSTFVIQNSAAGTSALGGPGNYFGFDGLTPSVAFEINLCSSCPGSRGIGFTTNGLTAGGGGPGYTAPGLINLASGDLIDVSLGYSSNLLSLAMLDTVTGAKYATNYPVNIPALLGSPTGLIGFTGGTGGGSSVQQFGGLSFSNGVIPSFGFVPPSPVFSVIVSNAYGSVTSSPAALWLDSNGNGIPDWWEMQYFGNLNQTAAGDYDGDGIDNLDEYLEGTNPTNAASFNPRLHLYAVNGSITPAPVQPYYTMGQIVTLTAAPSSGQQFIGWSGSITGTKPQITLLMNTNMYITANFGLPLGVALQNTNFFWDTGGNLPWTGQTQTTRNGLGAAQSGPIQPPINTSGIVTPQYSWFETETNLAQPMEISFWWNVSSEPPNGLSFTVDGVTNQVISGTAGGWQFFQANLPVGLHLLNWTYSMYTNDSVIGIPFSDSAWVEEVNLTPISTNASTPRLSIQASGGQTALVSWPAQSTGFTLQQNSNLANGSWVNVTNGFSVVGTNNELSIPLTSSNQFFRLMFP